MMSNRLIYATRLKYVKRFGRPVLIWNMGKVASTSIAHSLRAELGKASVLTSHFMNDADHPRSVYLYREFIEDNKHPIPLIALTREPISRNISSFFQNFQNNTGHSYSPDTYSTEQLLDFFLNRFDKHDVTLKWFDDNLKRYLGFDIYEKPFNKQQGYSIHEHRGFRILVLRSEESDQTKTRAIEQLLPINNFKLFSTNVGERKAYAADYASFRKNLRLPASYLDRMLQSKYTQHFYDADTISDLRARYL